ncbi:hypothetical protein J4Q44_G00376130 [Coregonus suidteri]|uniref:DOMON domain-containing protein n=1 Tax=Coregonus suidteri TaxID=861788 RepID=A0AAN8QD57_9TELE
MKHYSLQSSGQTFSFQLRGVSSGYIAVGLSTDSTQGGNDTTYVCANNNGIVNFFTALLDNKSLSVINTMAVNSVQGSVNDQIIQCTFNATVPNATVTTSTRGSATTFFLMILKGNFTNVVKGVDLGNPNATVTNSLNANTTAGNATTTAAPSSHAFVLQHTLSQALLILLGVLGMMML